MKKLKNSKGFTLMEMLIVVAIIAILVAIAIPTFTKQLEKAREATDMANLRSAYAEVMAAALTSGDEADGTIGNTGVVKAGNVFSKTVEATQKQAGWEGDDPVIGSVTVSKTVLDGANWLVKYDDATGEVTIDPAA